MMRLAAFGRSLAQRLLIVMVATLALLPLVGGASPASAQGTAIIEITNLDAGTGLPVPFTRFQVTSENGTLYGPLETDLNGYVAFSVTVDPQGTSFTAEEETPPACATAPEPQTTDPLMAGDGASLEFLTQNNPGCGLGTIALYAMACPDAFASSVEDYGPWRDGCMGTSDGTEFTLSSVATGQTWNPIAGAYGVPGRAPVVGLPAGDYTIQQNGDTPSSVFCLVYDTANYATSPEPSSVIPIPLVNGVGTVSLIGNRLSCDVFTVPGGAAQPEPAAEVIEPAGGATLDVHLAECPAGYVTSETIYDDCHGNGLSTISVQLWSDQGPLEVDSVVPVSPGPGIASFADLAAGMYSITPAVSGTISSYCSDAVFNEVASVFDASTNTLTLDLPAETAVTCDWYVVPDGPGNATIVVHVAQCPAGTDPTADLYTLCHESGIVGAEVIVRTDSGSAGSGFAGSGRSVIAGNSGPGVVEIRNLAGGSYSLEVGLPADLRDDKVKTTVVCSLDESGEAVRGESPDPYASPLYFQLPENMTVVCDWYVIPPADAYTTLQVTKFTCPVGLEASESTTLSQFQQACTTLTDDVDFTLAPLGQQGSTLTTGSAGNGSVIFESLPTGNYGLSEDIPGEFNTPWAFCGVEGGDLAPFTWIQGGDPLAIDATAGSYTCVWFNILEDLGQPSSLTLTKFLCPEGTTGDYQARCGSNPLSGATFLLEGPGSYEVDALTGANGMASFGALSAGAYTVTELPPAATNVSVYVVACSAGGQEFNFAYNDANGMRIDLDLPAATDVSCNWYNVPPGSPTVTPGETSGSITVHKFLCQGKSINQYNWDSDCLAETAPIAFSLETVAGLPIAIGTTNGSGILTFTNLANGAYNLDETSGDWCHAEADRVDTAGNVLVQNGGQNHISIYNCSLQNVDNLPSTGTGAPGAPARTEFDSDRLRQLLVCAVATLAIALIVRRGLLLAVVQSTEAHDEPVRPVRGEDPLI